MTIPRTPIAFFFVLPSALILLISGCKLDVNALNSDILAKTSGAERIFFEENIAGSDIDSELSSLAREAARFGYVDVLKYLQSRGADLNQADDFGWSPVLIGSAQGNLELVRYLVEIGGADVRAKTKSKTTALMYAAQSGNTELCRYLVDRGTNTNAKSIHGFTALMYAAAVGNLDIAKLLVERGADVQAQNNDAENALSFATRPEMVDYLKSIGLSGSQ